MAGFVYLLHDTGIFKVGQTSNLEGRQKKYKTHNPKVQWIALVEVNNPFQIETRILQELRFFYRQVKGTRDWFHGTLAEEAFRTMVQDALDLAAPSEESTPSLDEYLYKQVFGFAEGEESVPLSGLIWDALESGLEWASYIQGLRVTMLDNSTIQVSLTPFLSQSLLLLCVPETMSLLDFIEAVGNDEFNRMPSHVRKQLISILHGTPARQLLRGEVLIELARRGLPEIGGRTA